MFRLADRVSGTDDLCAGGDGRTGDLEAAEKIAASAFVLAHGYPAFCRIIYGSGIAHVSLFQDRKSVV